MSHGNGAEHAAASTRAVTVVIEDPRGSVTRHHLDRERGVWVEAPHPHSSTPWPANYGYLPGTINPADGDELDALVLATDPLPTGAVVSARPVGLLARRDRDHKALAVMVDDPAYGSIRRFADVPRRDVERIEAWFREWGDVGDWQDEVAAQNCIDGHRQATPGCDQSGRTVTNDLAAGDEGSGMTCAR
jgi:inorganic pyrophosphatase